MLQGRADGKPRGAGGGAPRVAQRTAAGQAGAPQLQAPPTRPARPPGRRLSPGAQGARSEPTGFDRPEDLRRLFWRAQRTAWAITKNKRQAWCRRVLRGDVVTIEKRPVGNRSLGSSGDRANFGGLFHCGRNGCPLCGPKIAAERAADIALAISAHYHGGGRVAFVTWTMRHSQAQRLSDLLAGLSKGYEAARRNKTPARLLRANSIGQIRKLETTVGPNGWHPHCHELVFLTPGTTDDQARELDDSRFQAWSASLERQGLGTADAKGHEFRILNLDQAHEKIGEYVAKSAGHELAAAGTKRARGENRSPLEVLIDLARDGLDRDRQLWLEYEHAMTGKRVLRWSPGLRKQLLGALQELTDQEAADSTDGAGRVIAAIGKDVWQRVCRWKHEPSLILSWAETYDDDDQARDLIARRLAQHGLGELEADMTPMPVDPRRSAVPGEGRT